MTEIPINDALAMKRDFVLVNPTARRKKWNVVIVDEGTNFGIVTCRLRYLKMYLRTLICSNGYA